MSREFAKKGWVVANINYRLGTHKAASYNMYALCNNSISAPCGYISDSAEIFRANYRGMQDAKGAIRFMKNRNAIDSSDVNNVFIVGESAGAFIAYATAFTDQSSEKSSLCNAISNAPIPDNNLTIYGCIPASVRRMLAGHSR
jgi:carboxylesterase type B